MSCRRFPERLAGLWPSEWWSGDSHRRDALLAPPTTPARPSDPHNAHDAVWLGNSLTPERPPRLALHVVAPRTSAWHIPWHPGLGARGVGARGPDRVPQPLPGPRRGAQGRSVPIRSIDDTRSAIAITSCESCEERAGPRATIRPRLSPRQRRQRRQRRAVSWWLLRLAILIVYATHAAHSLSPFRLTTS